MTDESVFAAAVAIPDPADRVAYLDRACAGAPELRQDVESLLAAHAASNPLDRPALDPTGAFAARSQSEESGRLAAGRLFAGRYKLREKLGEGGMGEVWVADQIEPVQRRVAVKVIRAGMDTARVLARFDQERQALAVMDHPNIARIFDAGVTADGLPYFVMELIKGVPITRYCDDAKLTPQARLELFVPVCQAVQHAHQKGVIHRDLKPNNILIGLYDGRPVPKVIDFGVAKATGPRLGEHSIYTEVGSVVGTLEYMSPEQAELNNLDIDTRSDVYALGVLLYEVLTGSVPFSRKELERAGFAEMLRVIKEQEPLRPSTRLSGSGQLLSVAAVRQTDPKRLTALLRGELDWIVMKALEKDRSRRYETANGFAADVQRYLVGEAVLAHPPGAGYRLRKFVRRNRGSVVAGVAFGLLLVAAAGVSSWLAVWATGAEREARHSERQAQADAAAAVTARDAEAAARTEADARRAQAELSVDLLASVFEGIDPDADRTGGADLRLELVARLDGAAKRLETQVTDPLARARLMDKLGITYVGLGHAARAVPLFERSRAIHEKHFGPAGVPTLTSRNYLANAYREAGRVGDAVRLTEESLELTRGQFGPTSPNVFGVLHELAAAYVAAGRPAEAIPHLTRLLARLTADRGPDDPHSAGTANALAMAYEHAGRVREAIPLYEELRDRYKRTTSPNSTVTLTALNNLAGAYRTDGRIRDAIPLLEEVANVRRAQVGVYHPATLTAMNNLALAYRDARRLDDAIPLYEEVLKYRTQRLGEDHPDTTRVRSNLGVAYKEAGRLPEAESHLKRAVELAERKSGPDHPDTLTYMNNLAGVYMATRRLPEAIRLYEQNLERTKAKLPPDHPDVLDAQNNLAAAYWRVGDLARSVPLFDRTLSGMEKTYGRDHPQTLQTQANLGINLFDAGRRIAGLTLVEDALHRAGLRPGPLPVQIGWLPEGLVRLYGRAGMHTKAEPLIRDELTAARDRFPSGHPGTANPLARLGINLLDQERYAEAEPLLRESLAIREKVAAGPNPPFPPSLIATTKGVLGRTLVGQQKFAEAEPLFLAEHAGLTNGPPYTHTFLRDAVEHLVDLYEAWGKPDRATEWKARRKPEVGPIPREVKP